MGLLNVESLKKPKVNLANVAVDMSIPPIDQVKIMSPPAFEQFITEWLYGCKINQYDRIVNIGGQVIKGAILSVIIEMELVTIFSVSIMALHFVHLIIIWN